MPNEDKTKKIFYLDIDIPDSEPLKGKYNKLWVEESFLIHKKIGNQLPLPKVKSHLGTNFTIKKAKFFFYFLLAIFLVVLIRVVQLQIVNGEKYYSQAQTHSHRLLPIPPERGLMFDRNYVQLTKNIPNFSLAIVPQELPAKKTIDREKIVRKLSELTHEETEKIRQILNDYGKYSYESIIIKENLDYETALSIQIAATDLPGIYILRGSKRLYLHDFVDSNLDNKISVTSTMSISHLLGYEGRISKNELAELKSHGYLPSDNIGKTGLEKYYEKEMRGVYGQREIEVDALGREQAILSEKPPIAGKHLLLSVDIKMQAKLEEVMNKYLKNKNKKRASGIVINPKNGEVLALVSLPAYDNNDFSGGITQEKYQNYLQDIDKPLYNRAISGNYPSGSSIKPAIALAALEYKIITSKTSFLSNGGLRIEKWFFPDWLAGGHGITDVRKSIAQSVNTFYYYIGGGYGNFKGMGVDRIISFLKLFNFSEKIGIDLPGENSGFLPSKQWKKDTKDEQWYIGDTYNLSIGQGDVLVTPLQIASMTATVANGGTMHKPHLVSGLMDSKNGKIEKIDFQPIKKDFVNSENVATIKLGMKDCVAYGSCSLLSSLPFSSGGKTGTAQWNSNKENHAWFTSFAPFEDPQIVVTIMVEEGGEGSGISEPIAYEFYRWWANYRNVDNLF